jgi:uncharacterized protein (DUF1501 family)
MILHSPARRRLLRAMAAAPLALCAPGIAATPAANRLLVMVFLYGGNDGYNTWVPYTNPLYYRLRPHIAVARDSVLKITPTHGLHPSLAALVPAWEAKDLAIVQGLGYPESTQQHFRDIETAFTGCDGTDFSADGWVTRAIARATRPAAMADAVAFDLLDIRLADPMGPFRGEKIAALQVYRASDLLQSRHVTPSLHEATALGRAKLARHGDTLGAMALRTRFPSDPFGESVRAAVELAALDRSLPVIHLALNGLDDDKHHSVDTHLEQLEWHGDALKRLADGLAALRAGLIEIGRWDETLVATYDEFGRSPVENEAQGTHHGHATTHFVMGGKVRGGLHGEAPAVQRLYPIGGPAPVIDTRRLWTTVVEQWWNLPDERVFTRRHRPLDLLRA